MEREKRVCAFLKNETLIHHLQEAFSNDPVRLELHHSNSNPVDIAPDLFLLEEISPDQPLDNLLSDMKSRFPETPVVILLDSGSSSQLTHYFEAGASDVMFTAFSLTINPRISIAVRKELQSHEYRQAMQESQIKLKRMNRMYSFLSQINQAIVWTHHRDNLLKRICTVGIEYGKFSLCWFGTLEAAGKTVRIFEGVGQAPVLPPIGEKVSAELFGNDLQLCSTPESIQEKFCRNASLVSPGCGSFVAITIRQNGIPALYFGVCASEADFFDEDELSLIREIAGDISFALDKLDDDARRKETEEKLRQNESLLTRILETIPDGLVIADPSGQITYANAAAEEILHSRKDIITQRHYFDHVWRHRSPEGHLMETDELPISRVLSSGETIHQFVHSIEDDEGNRHVLSVNAVPLKTGNGTMAALASFADITQSFDAIAGLRKSEERYRALYTSMIEGVALHEIITDDSGKPVDYRFIDVNPSFERLTGFQREELVGRRVLEVMPNTEPYWIETYGKVALEGTPAHFENYARELGKYYEVIAYCPVKGQFATIFFDITSRKTAEEKIQESLKAKDVLLKEVHHRVKNNLQIISSLLRLQEGYITDEKALSYLRDSQQRIKSMAIIHEKLYQSENFARVNFRNYLQDLSVSVFSSFGHPQKIKLATNLEPVTLSIDLAIPTGLLVNEILTNACKYAFPADRTGTITVEMKKNRKKRNEVLIRIADDGVGLPEDAEKSDTLGLSLIQTLSKQIDGKLKIGRSDGTSYEIRLSAEESPKE